jgi:adenylate cyclase class 2
VAADPHDSATIFTLKKDNGRRMDSTEYELQIADAKAMEQIVRAMGYELYTTMTKTRQKAKIGEVEVCLDKIEGLGTFVEAEIMTHTNDNHAKVVTKLWDALQQLGITRDAEVTDAYDVLLRRKEQQTI